MNKKEWDLIIQIIIQIEYCTYKLYMKIVHL